MPPVVDLESPMDTVMRLSAKGKPAKEKRRLRFTTLDDIRTDLHQLIQRGYEQTGHWSLGQTCEHLCKFINFSLDGFPFELPRMIRPVVGVLISKKKIIEKGFPQGIKLSGKSAVLLPRDQADDKQMLNDLLAALTRLEQEQATQPSPMLGKLSHEEWLLLHLRHAELHLGMLIPKA